MRRVLEQARDPLSEQDRVVGEHHPHPLDQLARVPQRREVGGKPRHGELKEHLRRRETDELVLAECLDLLLDRLAGRGREDDLPAVTGLADPRRPVDVDPDIAVLVQRRRSRVDAHPHPHVGVVRPVVLAERSLGRDCCADGVRDLLEHGKELVAVRVDLDAALGLGRRPDQAPDIGERASVGLAQPLDQPGGSLDVAEEKRDGAGRKRRHAVESTDVRPAGSRLGSGCRAAAG
jgi:hypothetical protein